MTSSRLLTYWPGEGKRQNVYGEIKGQNANLLVYIGFAMTHSLYIRPSVDGLYRDGTAHVSGV